LRKFVKIYAKKKKKKKASYSSNCGINRNINALNAINTLDTFNSIDTFENVNVDNKRCKIIFFDLETSGFETDCDILQIAAVCKKNEFSVYAVPTQPISNSASKAHNIYRVREDLFLKDVKVDAIKLCDALISFSQFLNAQSSACILIAHNAYFDKSQLINAIIKNNLRDNFNMICDFTDFLTYIKKQFSDRKGAGAYKLSNLANELLEADVNTYFHDTLYDVQILQKLVDVLGHKESLFSLRQTFQDSLIQITNNKKCSNAIFEFGDQKTIVSRNILKKICSC